MGPWIPTQECQTQNVTSISVVDGNVFASWYNRISHLYQLWGPITMGVDKVGKLMGGLVRAMKS